jgi:inorganic pyrophosphatase
MLTLPHLTRLPAHHPQSGLFVVVIDTPRGSRNKFKYDDELNLFWLSKVLPLGSSFPYDFGFIPSTRAEDGDPLDVLVLMDEPAFSGSLVTVQLLGGIEAEQTEKGKTVRNDRLIATVETPYNRPDMHTLEDVGAARLDEIEHFFVSYNQAEGRQFQPVRRYGPDVAERIVTDTMRRFEEAETAGTAAYRDAAHAVPPTF